MKYFEYFISSVAANDPQAVAAAKVNAAQFKDFKFDPEVRRTC